MILCLATNRNNFHVDWDEFVHAAREDYRLLPNSKLRGKGLEPPDVEGMTFRVDKEYVHQRSLKTVNPKKTSPGAYQN
jgi:hypothetical protein